MLTLRCKTCGHEWQASKVEPCTECTKQHEVYRHQAGERSRRLYGERKEQLARRAGHVVNDREAICEGCKKPLRGYSAYEVDDETGAACLMCECGHANELPERERGRILSGGALWRA